MFMTSHVFILYYSDILCCIFYMYYYIHELIFVVLIHLCIFCSNVPDLTVVKFLPFLLPYSLNLYVVLFNICDCFLVPIMYVVLFLKVVLFCSYYMSVTYQYLWYPLFQAQCDRCDQRNHQTWNYLVKGHHIYSGT